MRLGRGLLAALGGVARLAAPARRPADGPVGLLRAGLGPGRVSEVVELLHRPAVV